MLTSLDCCMVDCDQVIHISVGGLQRAPGRQSIEFHSPVKPEYTGNLQKHTRGFRICQEHARTRKSEMQPFRMQGIVIFCLIFVLTVTEGILDFDCRRNKVTCVGDTPTVDHCALDTGDCTCTDGTEGYNCGLNTADIATCATDECLNGATCTTSGSCYCSTDTYGPKCQNFRVAVWCTDEKMYINVNPHADAFAGNLFVSAEDITAARDNALCQMTNLTSSAVPEWVNEANGVPLTDLAGYYLEIDHKTTENGGTSECGSAVVTPGENGSGLSYIRRVAIEYRSDLTTSLDQMLNVVCMLQNTSDLKTSSFFNATIANNNYQQVNISDSIEPVSFEILDAASKPITSTIHLGDQVNLKFTVIFDTYTALKVKECNATNGKTDDTAKTINFFKNDCPVLEWGALFRGGVLVDETEKSSTLQLSAFRFNGDVNTVMFVCSLQLCTVDNADACNRRPCGSAPAVTPITTQAPTEAPTDAPTEAPSNETEVTPLPGRRKRASVLQEEARLTNSVQVVARNEFSSAQDAHNSATNEDCMEHNEVVIIIVTFSVALALLLILVVVLVIQRLRSRVKVVDTSDVASADSHSHYSLPRLSAANF